VLDLFHDTRRHVVRVRQRNRLAQFVASVLPEYGSYQHDGLYAEPAPVRIDLDQCLRSLHDRFLADRILDELVRHSPAIDVELEELDGDATLVAMQRFLGVTPTTLSSPLQRPPAKPVREVIENWDDVESILRGTVWEPFIDE
jgi:hypothetical protein